MTQKLSLIRQARLQQDHPTGKHGFWTGFKTSPVKEEMST